MWPPTSICDTRQQLYGPSDQYALYLNIQCNVNGDGIYTVLPTMYGHRHKRVSRCMECTPYRRQRHRLLYHLKTIYLPSWPEVLSLHVDVTFFVLSFVWSFYICQPSKFISLVKSTYRFRPFCYETETLDIIAGFWKKSCIEQII